MKSVNSGWLSGLVTQGERCKSSGYLVGTNDLVAQAMMEELSADIVKDKDGNRSNRNPSTRST